MIDWQKTFRASPVALITFFAIGGLDSSSSVHGADPGPAHIRAIDLSALDGEILVDTDDDLRGLNDFSFDLIFQFKHSHEGHFFSLHEAWNSDGFYLKIRDDNRLELVFGNRGKISQLLSAEDLFEDSRWYRLSGVKDGKIAKLFIDGKVAQSAEVIDNIVDTDKAFQIGRSGDFSAAIQVMRFRFWGDALRADQIIALTAEDDRFTLPSPLIHYDFSIGGGELIENKASRKYNGHIESRDGELGWVDIDIHQADIASETNQANWPEERRLVLDAGEISMQTLAASTPVGAPSIDLRNALLILLALAMPVTGLAWLILQRPIVFRRGIALATPASASDDETETERRLLPQADVRRISGKLEQALDDDRLYRNPDLTLRQLSDAVGVTEHRISEVMNQHLDTSFYDFINGRRIAEAKLILQRDLERTVLDVAMDVGYNSKSTFYAAFKKVTGQSPAAFRRSVAIRDDQEQVDATAAPKEPKRVVTP